MCVSVCVCLSVWVFVCVCGCVCLCQCLSISQYVFLSLSIRNSRFRTFFPHPFSFPLVPPPPPSPHLIGLEERFPDAGFPRARVTHDEDGMTHIEEFLPGAKTQARSEYRKPRWRRETSCRTNNPLIWEGGGAEFHLRIYFLLIVIVFCYSFFSVSFLFLFLLRFSRSFFPLLVFFFHLPIFILVFISCFFPESCSIPSPFSFSLVHIVHFTILSNYFPLRLICFDSFPPLLSIYFFFSSHLSFLLSFSSSLLNALPILHFSSSLLHPFISLSF